METVFGKTSGKKPDVSIFEAIEKAGRPIEEYARNTIITLVTVDYFHFKGALEELGKETYQRLYNELWNRVRTKYIDAISIAMEAVRPGEASSVSRVLRVYFDSIYCPFKVVEETATSCIGIIPFCPFVEYTSRPYGEKVGDAYFETLASRCADFPEEALRRTRTSNTLTVVQGEQICKGDRFCKITIDRKG